MERQQRGTGLLLGTALVAMGLISGSFYVFACAVMPGLARGSDRAYIEVMQNINVVIQNPVFGLSFMGSLVFTAAAAWRVRRTPLRWWVLAALLVYGVALLLTFTTNVPLNDELADAGDPARIADPARVRADFEDMWVVWNGVRAVLCTVAFGLLARALVLWGALGRAPGRAVADPAAHSPYFDPTAGSSASR
ncbi:DUF1772 domain-containing protein [Streptomyces sp. G45]|uniref:anthrone oxygenase family protein n=1 Tax=Streptomyces sp. G45 TaxID=3406627 RepID=UPI003C296178